jgi:TonB family protein
MTFATLEAALAAIVLTLTLGCGGPRHRPWTSPDASARIYSDVELDVPPEPIRIPIPRYPADLRQREVPGRVEMELVIGPDGRVEPGSVKVLAATHGSFARSATEAMKDAEYEPGLLGGVRVRVRVKHVMQFRMRPH